MQHNPSLVSMLVASLRCVVLKSNTLELEVADLWAVIDRVHLIQNSAAMST